MTTPATEPLADGIHTHADYRPDSDRLSPSGAKKLLPPSTPARFDYDRRHPPKDKPVFDVGRVAHKLVLGEGDQFLILDPEIHGLKKDGTRADKPSATTSWKDAEANAREEGLVPIHVDDYTRAVEMAQAAHEHEIAGPLLTDGYAERWLYWTDTESGQPLRTRLDWITRKDDQVTVVEYKTTADASPEAFARTVFRYGYHVAAAFAVWGAKALLHDTPEYRIIAQEKEPPYQVSVHRLDAEALRYSRTQMCKAIEVYQQCMQAGQWPSYPAYVNWIPLPAWAIDDEMEFAK